MVDHHQIREDELHVYVDGELPPDRRDAVEAWLASHPDDAVRVAAWRAQADTIRARYGSVVNEPIPDRLSMKRIMRGQKSWSKVAAAAAIAAFLFGGAAGWLVRGATDVVRNPVETFTADALDAHKLYISEVRHPIEVRANEDHLLPWLSKRVGTTLRAPDLGQFDLKLLGGRLLPGVSGPAALFMYENSSGQRFTIYCSRLDAGRTAFRYDDSDGIGAVRWIESNYGWVVSGPKDKDRLKSIASSAYDQVENRTPAPSQGAADQLISRRGS
jgi:anti-sigma factor RsiW